MTEPGEQAELLRAEIARLRLLIGDDEANYRQLRDDRDRAIAAARDSEHELGRARGTVAEMQVQLVRARQDQERFQTLLTVRRSLREQLARGKRRLISLLPSRS